MSNVIRRRRFKALSGKNFAKQEKLASEFHLCQHGWYLIQFGWKVSAQMFSRWKGGE